MTDHKRLLRKQEAWQVKRAKMSWSQKLRQVRCVREQAAAWQQSRRKTLPKRTRPEA